MSRARDVLLALVVVAALAFLAPSVLARIDTDLRDAVGGVRQASGAGATSEGWSQVQSAYELSGPLSREGLGYLLAAGLRGGHPCLLEMTPGTSLQCRTMLDTNGPVTALAGHGEWMLAATGAAGNAPRTWTADTAYVRAPDADAAEGRHVPVNGSLPAGARITAAAIDDDSYFPLVAGTVPAGSVRPITEREIQDTLAGSGRNRWLPRDQINEAALGQGLMNGRLRVVLTDGTSAKLLWLKDDTVHDVLRSTLEEWLGNRLTLR